MIQKQLAFSHPNRLKQAKRIKHVQAKAVMDKYKPLARPIVEIDYRKFGAPAWRLRAGLVKYIDNHKELRMSVVYKNRRLFLINRRHIRATDINGAINNLLGE